MAAIPLLDFLQLPCLASSVVVPFDVSDLVCMRMFECLWLPAGLAVASVARLEYSVDIECLVDIAA